RRDRAARASLPGPLRGPVDGGARHGVPDDARRTVPAPGHRDRPRRVRVAPRRDRASQAGAVLSRRAPRRPPGPGPARVRTTGRLARVQALSGLAFALFLALHLATTASGIAGPAAYDGTLALLRRVYRPTLAIEALLIGVPLVAHVACAILQIAARRRDRSP